MQLVPFQEVLEEQVYHYKYLWFFIIIISSFIHLTTIKYITITGRKLMRVNI